MNDADRSRALRQIADRAVPSTRDLWSALRWRVGAPRSRATSRSAALLWERRRGLATSVATALVLALLVAATLPLWSHPEAVSAQTVFDRADSAATSPQGISTYHTVTQKHFPSKGDATATSEVWFGGSGLQRVTDVFRDSTGAEQSVGEVVLNADQAWIAQTQGGQTRVAHTIGTTWNGAAEDPSKLTSLSDVLAQYGGSKTCMTAALKGEATVAGRAAYVLLVTSNFDACGSEAGSGKSSQDKLGQVGSMTVWVDKVSYLPLKTEVRNAAGELLDASEVTRVEYNVSIPGSTFTYTPPAGAQVYTFAGGTGTEVKEALSIVEGKGHKESDTVGKQTK